MPVQSQFSLSVELTKLVPFAPLATAAAKGVLNLARALSNTGSDIVVEEDLADVFGRNRISPQFVSTFRQVVKESSVQQISQYLDITLNAGAGPTVNRALQDPRYLSTVIQLSLLTWNYGLRSFANGLSYAMAQRCKGAPLDQQNVPSFDALHGTLQSCREQTAAFNWGLLFDAVSSVLDDQNLGINSERPRFNKPGNLPVSVLQGCLDFLSSVQHFPEERFFRIRMPSE